jgi:hypothetical protein
MGSKILFWYFFTGTLVELYWDQHEGETFVLSPYFCTVGTLLTLYTARGTPTTVSLLLTKSCHSPFAQNVAFSSIMLDLLPLQINNDFNLPRFEYIPNVCLVCLQGYQHLIGNRS